MKRTSSSVAWGRDWSMRRSSRMLAASEATRHAAAINVVRRRALIYKISSTTIFSSKILFQVSVLENEEGSAQSYRGITKRVKRIVQDKLSRYRLLMRDG